MSEKKPEVTHMGLLDMQVCVPSEYTDDEVVAFAEEKFPCGTTGGWQIRRERDYKIEGQLERGPCKDREGYVHIMLDA